MKSSWNTRKIVLLTFAFFCNFVINRIYVISKNRLQVVLMARNHKFDFGSKSSLFNNLRFRHATLTVQLMLPYDSTTNDCLDA